MERRSEKAGRYTCLRLDRVSVKGKGSIPSGQFSHLGRTISITGDQRDGSTSGFGIISDIYLLDLSATSPGSGRTNHSRILARCVYRV